MLEGRTDVNVHKPVALWLDTRVLKERIVQQHDLFLHLCNQEIGDPCETEPTEVEMQTLLSYLSEEETADLFQEPLELMALVRAISDTNPVFKGKMEPAIPSLPDKNSFV